MLGGVAVFNDVLAGTVWGNIQDTVLSHITEPNITFVACYQQVWFYTNGYIIPKLLDRKTMIHSKLLDNPDFLVHQQDYKKIC